MTDVVTEDIGGSIRTSRCRMRDSWSVGVQRSVGSNMAVEVRYVGTRGKDQWRTSNGRQRHRDAELQRVQHLRQRFPQRVQTGAGQPAGQHRCRPRQHVRLYRGGRARRRCRRSWRSSTRRPRRKPGTRRSTRAPTGPTDVPELPGRSQPQPVRVRVGQRQRVDGQRGPAQRMQRPPVSRQLLRRQSRSDWRRLVSTNIGESKYDSLQVELRRRYAQGLQFQTSYVSARATSRTGRRSASRQFYLRDAGTPGDMTHQFKANVVYDMPFGHGRRFAQRANAVVDRIIGGWQIGLSSQDPERPTRRPGQRPAGRHDRRRRRRRCSSCGSTMRGRRCGCCRRT